MVKFNVYAPECRIKVKCYITECEKYHWFEWFEWIKAVVKLRATDVWVCPKHYDIF